MLRPCLDSEWSGLRFFRICRFSDLFRLHGVQNRLQRASLHAKGAWDPTPRRSSLMFTTTFTALALSGLMAVGNEALVPSWQSDYRTAMQAALAQQRPMAVFIGRGEAGFDRLVSDGKISAESGKLLATDYVCVYVDTSTPAGQTLAGQFQINEGLVISTPGGQIQALRHTGAVS